MRRTSLINLSRALPAAISCFATPVFAQEMPASTLLDRRVQLNGAVFHYDYVDKQFAGRVILTPNLFGALETLVNVPKSRVNGAELQIDLAPFRGLTLNLGATYLDTRVKGFTNYDVFGAVTDFSGQGFPNSPKLQTVADAEYDWNLSDHFDSFVGASGNYQSASNGLFGEYSQFRIKRWATLDLIAGIEAPDESWKVFVWGRNVTDAYYWSTTNSVLDTQILFAGAPATYGLTMSFRGHG